MRSLIEKNENKNHLLVQNIEEDKKKTYPRNLTEKREPVLSILKTKLNSIFQITPFYLVKNPSIHLSHILDITL